MSLSHYLNRTKEVYRTQGLSGVVRQTLIKVTFYYYLRGVYRTSKSFAVYTFLNFTKKERSTFVFHGKEYCNYYHWYNSTWRNERTVEIPIFLDLIAGSRGKKILEIGNVLSHYEKIDHDVLDKYEKARGVINEDVASFCPREKYDLIISISTMEHVGWDENQRDPRKVLFALQHLRNDCLSKDGRIVLSVPLGYNPPLDQLIRAGELNFAEKNYLRRISEENKWREISEEEALGARYGDPFPAANVVLVGSINAL